MQGILKVTLVLLVVPAIGFGQVKVESREYSSLECYIFFTDGEPLNHAVLTNNNLRQNLSRNNLSEDYIENYVEGRLSGAQIPLSRDAGFPYLTVRVESIADVFHIDVKFGKRFTESYGAILYHSQTFDLHSANMNFLLISVSQEMDKFLNAFLEARENCS